MHARTHYRVSKGNSIGSGDRLRCCWRRDQYGTYTVTVISFSNSDSTNFTGDFDIGTTDAVVSTSVAGGSGKRFVTCAPDMGHTLAPVCAARIRLLCASVAYLKEMSLQCDMGNCLLGCDRFQRRHSAMQRSFFFDLCSRALLQSHIVGRF